MFRVADGGNRRRLRSRLGLALLTELLVVGSGFLAGRVDVVFQAYGCQTLGTRPQAAIPQFAALWTTRDAAPPVDNRGENSHLAAIGEVCGVAAPKPSKKGRKSTQLSGDWVTCEEEA